MKLNIAYPATGCQKLIDIEDERVVRPFYEKRMGTEIGVDFLGEEWKDYIVRISGGNDKQGFPMKQGVLTNDRVRLLLSKGHSCYRPRRDGERKRKSVRGCIVDSNLSVLALVIVKKGATEIEGLTDKTIPRRLGPKRASKIRKLFNLSKEDDVRRYVIGRPLAAKDGKKEKRKAPKIQRLITPSVRMHFRQKRALKKDRADRNLEEKSVYAKLLAKRHKEARDKKEELKKRRSSARSSRTSESSVEKVAVKPTVKQAGAATAKAVSKTTAKKTDSKKKVDPKQLAKDLSKAKKETKAKAAPAKKPEVKSAAPAKKVTKAAPAAAKAAAPAKKEVKAKAAAPAKKADPKPAAAPAKKAEPKKASQPKKSESAKPTKKGGKK